MPMLADIEDPPRSRLRDLGLGLLVGFPIIAALIGWFVPMLVATVLGGAQALDDRLRQQDAYIQELCSVAFSLPRDEELCGCALSVEFPALDCQDPFRRWALEQASTQCAPDDAHAQALSYCSCIEVVTKDLAAATEQSEQRRIAQGFDRCIKLSDTIALPAPATLAPDAT